MDSRPERLILEKYGDCVVGLMMYGSMAYGRPRKGSIPDFWVIVDDLEAFHSRNAGFYRMQLNKPSTVEKQIALNRGGPLFYRLTEGGAAMKLAVIGEADFVRICRGPRMVIKGRMQKPLKMIRTTPAIEEAIADAQQDGLKHALNLVPRRFTMEEFLINLVSLSYLAEIRPERKTAKIRSIVDAGRKELEAIYAPLLEACDHVEQEDDHYADTRDPAARKQGRRATRRYLRGNKWSLDQLRYICRNYRSYGAPIRYIWEKVLGEIEKWRRRG